MWKTLKDNKNYNKYLDLAREFKKLWDMNMTIIQIVIGAFGTVTIFTNPSARAGFGTVTKGLLKGLEDLEVEGRVDTIQTTALLRTARILEESWRLVETCCHSNSSENPSAYTDVKNSKSE